MKQEFKDWYSNNLRVNRYPVIKDIARGGIHHDVDLFLNVSDEFNAEYSNIVQNWGCRAYWFPMGEIHHDIGLSSIYGALTILYHAYECNLVVLLHCHAGANRSPTVRDCFHYMMTGEHLETQRTRSGIFVKSPNMLFYNCEYKHLPELPVMELWLKACKEAFDNPEKFIGGMYDWTLRECGLQEK